MLNKGVLLIVDSIQSLQNSFGSLFDAISNFTQKEFLKIVFFIIFFFHLLSFTLNTISFTLLPGRFNLRLDFMFYETSNGVFLHFVFVFS